jgi:hypothetical protein
LLANIKALTGRDGCDCGKLCNWGPSLIFKKPNNLSNTFFEWAAIGISYRGTKNGPARQAKRKTADDLEKKYELFARSVVEVLPQGKG